MKAKQTNPLNQFAKRVIKACDKFIEYADTHSIPGDAQQITNRVSALATDLERFVSGEPGAAPAKHFTVIGFYEATGETFATFFGLPFLAPAPSSAPAPAPAPSSPAPIAVKVICDTGNSWVTTINATLDGARAYYIGTPFTREDANGKEITDTPVSVELVADAVETARIRAENTPEILNARYAFGRR